MADPDQARAARYPLVLRAVQQAAAGTHLIVKPQGELYGASVIGPFVEAYVIPTQDGGVQVDMWRHHGDDPYRTVKERQLTNAVQMAVAAAFSAGEPVGPTPPLAGPEPRSRLGRRSAAKGNMSTVNGVIRARISGQLAICIGLFLNHRIQPEGRCRCGIAAGDCPSRSHSAKVIKAPGLDPARLDRDLGDRRAALLWLRTRGEHRRHLASPATSVPERARACSALPSQDRPSPMGL